MESRKDGFWSTSSFAYVFSAINISSNILVNVIIMKNCFGIMVNK